MVSWYLRSIAILAVLQVCSLSELAYAQGQTLREMHHAAWTARDGAPQVINALAQDGDGTLWIGSESGLVNFDGQTFRPFQSPAGEAEIPPGQVYSLLVTADGTIWVGFYEAAARISAGRVTVFSHAESHPFVLVEQLSEALDGSIWAIDGQRYLVRFGSDGTWRREPAASSTRIRGLFIDSANTLWLAQDGFLHRRPLSQASYTQTAVPADVVSGFAETPSGEIWMSDHDRVASVGRMQKFSPSGNRIRMFPFKQFTSAIAYAADGSLLVATYDAGVHRLLPEGPSWEAHGDSSTRPDVFTREHGLSSNAARELMFDLHGNLWIGGPRGLDRLRPAQLSRYVPAADAPFWAVCASKRGEVWLASSNGELYSVAAGARISLPRLTGERVHSVACADGGHAWFTKGGVAWAVVSGRIASLPPIEGIRPNGILKVLATSSHTFYATVSGEFEDGGGIWQFRSNRWVKLPHEGELGAGGYAAYIDRRDHLWIGYSAGRAIRHAAGDAQIFSSGEPGLGYVYAFLDGSRGLFAAGVNGLAVFRNSRFEMLTFAEPALVRGARGLVEARNGDLWLNCATGIAHIPVKELEAGLNQPTYRIQARLIREGDAAGAAQDVVGYMDTAARDADGRLWFVTRSGVVHLDPNRTAASQPPILTIRSMTVDGRRIMDNRILSPGVRTLEMQYLGVNLTAPEDVTYRYRLDGFDDSWQEAGHRTEAIYTRLPPGTYTFAVMASSADGNWTDPVAAAPFTVMPSFYQTRWFAAAMVGLAVLLVSSVYRFRIRQISRVMSARFDERLAERTRVARELHDTLLQTVHGSKLVADRALRDTDDHHRLVQALEQLSVWLGQAAAEGRAALQSLRASTTESNDLAGAFRRAIEECRDNSRAETPFSVQGRAREMPA